MRKAGFLLLSILLSLLLSAHIGQSQEIKVLHALGSVSYHPAEGQAGQRVLPGQQFPAEGYFELDEDARLVVRLQEQTLKLNDPGKYYLAQLGKTAPQQTDFNSRFWEYVTEGLEKTDEVKTIRKYHREHMTQVKGAIKGFGEGEYALLPLGLAFGRLGREKTVFQWTAVPGARHYRFQLIEVASGEEIIRLPAGDTLLHLDLCEIFLENGTDYHWRVSAVLDSDSVLASPHVPFTFHPEDAEKRLARLSKSEDYQQADMMVQKLMETTLLEDRQFYQQADRRYQLMLAEYPQETLPRRLYAAFLARMGDPEAAAQLIERP